MSLGVRTDFTFPDVHPAWHRFHPSSRSQAWLVGARWTLRPRRAREKSIGAADVIHVLGPAFDDRFLQQRNTGNLEQ